ncbi:MAG: SRPBCC domain-containing protein [Steroidobacteraceae bacterium]
MSSRILVSLRVRATPRRAFDVFVNEIDVWWQPNTLFRFTPHSPGTLAIERGLSGRMTETSPDGEVFEIGRITAWEPGVKLAFTWRQASFSPDQLTYVEVRFETVGEETRVTVEHRGWDSVPQDHVARHHFPDAVFLRRHGEWWQMLLAGVARRIEAERAA